MIIDKLENISNYSNISQNVVDFLINLSAEKEVGHYVIDEYSYANVDIYSTKSHNDCKFESHEKYVDIQMLLSGVEELDYLPVNDLDVSEQYDPKRDITFYKKTDKIPDKIILEPGKFALIYPYEAHMPQMNYNNVSNQVKKVVVKILVSS